jgi:hypothetical protein
LAPPLVAARDRRQLRRPPGGVPSGPDIHTRMRVVVAREKYQHPSVSRPYIAALLAVAAALGVGELIQPLLGIENVGTAAPCQCRRNPPPEPHQRGAPAIVAIAASRPSASGDASASWSKYGDDLALRRMERAGAVITTVDQIISELAIDWTSPNGRKLEAILDYR